MATSGTKSRELKNIGYELFVGGLSILSIVNIVLGFIYSDISDLQMVIYAMNAIMTPVFLFDFIYRISTSEDRARYFFRGFGWADLLSSLPFPRAKILRLFRLWRVIRLFRAFGARNLVHEFIVHRAENALLTVVFLVICVLEFGAIYVLRAESRSPDANIKNASDALWWTYVTITTVGYGDRFPVTNAGRIVGLLVMTAGVGLFGTLSGFLANAFLSPPKRRLAPAEAPDADDPKARLEEIVHMIEAQERSTAELKTKLQEISKLV